MTERLDPVLFVAAERYAIRRWLTGAAQAVAEQILTHADLVKRDQGICQAIVHDVEDLLRDEWGAFDATFGTKAEWEANRARWARVAEELRKP